MASIPETMKAISIPKTGGVEVLEYRDLPVPSPKEGEVLIKNDYAGVNFIDTYFRTGLYPAPSFPHTLGREGAGEIVAVGSGKILGGLKVGDRVAYLSPGAYAEYVAANSATTYALPSGIDNKTAAASLVQGLTAITLIREAHYVNKGDWVLVHAAAGGMGLWLCGLLKAVGAHTIGTASTPAKRELAKKAGAEVVLEYAETIGNEEFVKKVEDLTGGNGVVAVFDGVGKATFDVSLECVARKGSMISFGNASGPVPPFTIARLSAKNVKLMRTTVFNYIATREEFDHYCKELFDIMEKEKADITVHKVYDLKDAADAHNDIEGRKTVGKLLIKP